MTFDEKEMYLRSYGDLIELIEELKERIEITSEIGTHIAQQYSDNGHASGTKSNVENAAVKDLTNQIQLNYCLTKKERLKREILRNIHSLKNKRHAKLLIKKYIDLNSDFDICLWAGISLSTLDKNVKKAIEELEVRR